MASKRGKTLLFFSLFLSDESNLPFGLCLSAQTTNGNVSPMHTVKAGG
jgi:hypothetical protein